MNAGHNPPMLFRGSGAAEQVIRLDVAGVVVGLLRDFEYQQAAVTLETGDLLVAYTDGISEAMTAAEEEWGEGRMIAAIRSCAGLNATEIMGTILAAADAFAAGASQHDDMTLLVLRVCALAGRGSSTSSSSC